MESIVKAMYKYFQGFKNSMSEFPSLSDAKVKDRVFIGPQNQELFKDGN